MSTRGDHVSARDEIRVHGQSRLACFLLSVGQVLEEDREFLARLPPVG
jgi:hypothetical protein